MQKNGSSGYRDGTSSSIDSYEDYHTPIRTQKEETSPNRNSSGGSSMKNDSSKSRDSSSRKMDSLIDYYQITPKSSSSGLCSRFSSQKSSKLFPPKSSSTDKSVSLTPPPSSSSSSSSDEDCSDSEYNELKSLNELCCIHLESASRELEIVRKQNEDLESINKSLKNRLVALLELRLSIRDNGGGSTNNRVVPSRESDPVTSPTSVIGNISQGFESFDEIPFQFQSEEGVSSPNSISFRSIVSFLNQPNSAPVSSPTSVSGNINQGFESFDEMPFQFQSEEGVSSPNSISFRSIVSFLNQPNSVGTDSTAPSSNTNTNRLRFAATPSVPEPVPRMQLPIIPSVDESKNGGVDEMDPLELDLN